MRDLYLTCFDLQRLKIEQRIQLEPLLREYRDTLHDMVVYISYVNSFGWAGSFKSDRLREYKFGNLSSLESYCFLSS